MSSRGVDSGNVQARDGSGLNGTPRQGEVSQLLWGSSTTPNRQGEHLAQRMGITPYG